MDNRQIVESEYQNLIELIKDASKEVRSVALVNQQTIGFKEDLVKFLDQKAVPAVERAMKQSLDEMHWDKLVIALFGETNAGKSTIIETFRILFDANRQHDSDGRIVGDGQSDFTKEYHEYELSIEGRPFVLIDVPGIEGNESEFTDGIKKALSKSHCVFYVQGHNKPLEEPILEKIKDYLGGWVQVYSIYNVRGSIRNYDEEEERETLLTNNVSRIESSIKESFTRILGDVYKGNITLQALLAMCAKASFSPERPDLIKSQERLLNYFGSTEEILKFSQFQTLINQVKLKADNFFAEIASSDMLKILSFKRDTVSELKGLVDEWNPIEYKSQLELLKSNLNAITDEINQNVIKSRVNALINSEFDSAAKDVNQILEKSENKKSDLKARISELSHKIMSGMNDIFKNAAENWNEFVTQKSSEFAGINFLTLTLPQIKETGGIKIDFSDALKKLGIEASDVGCFVGALGGGALTGAGVGGPVGAVIGGVVGGASHVGRKCIFGDGGLSDAKSLAKNDLFVGRERLKPRLNRLVSQAQNIVVECKKKNCDQIANEIESVETILRKIDNINSKFKQTKIF